VHGSLDGEKGIVDMDGYGRLRRGTPRVGEGGEAGTAFEAWEKAECVELCADKGIRPPGEEAEEADLVCGGG
jgi:hypothetical protein